MGCHDACPFLCLCHRSCELRDTGDPRTELGFRFPLVRLLSCWLPFGFRLADPSPDDGQVFQPDFSAAVRLESLTYIGSCKPFHDDDASEQKSKKACCEPRPMALGNKIKFRQHHADVQQQAAEKPQLRPGGRNTFLHRPPKAAEENCPKHVPAKRARIRA